MARYVHHGVARDTYGNIVREFPISIYLTDTTTPAIIFDSYTGGLPVSAAPQIITDTVGRFKFYIDDSYYTKKGTLFDIEAGGFLYDKIDIFVGVDAHDELEELDGLTITLTDLGFRCKDGIPDNVKLCEKGTWNERMFVETAFSMLTVVCNAKKIFHRVAAYIEARMAYTMAMFNVLLALFHELNPDAPAHQMSIAQFSL